MIDFDTFHGGEFKKILFKKLCRNIIYVKDYIAKKSRIKYTKFKKTNKKQLQFILNLILTPIFRHKKLISKFKIIDLVPLIFKLKKGIAYVQSTKDILVKEGENNNNKIETISFTLIQIKNNLFIDRVSTINYIKSKCFTIKNKLSHHELQIYMYSKGI